MIRKARPATSATKSQVKKGPLSDREKTLHTILSTQKPSRTYMVTGLLNGKRVTLRKRAKAPTALQEKVEGCIMKMQKDKLKSLADKIAQKAKKRKRTGSASASKKKKTSAGAPAGKKRTKKPGKRQRSQKKK